MFRFLLLHKHMYKMIYTAVKHYLHPPPLHDELARKK
jgi:hypothetical protein